MPGVTMIQPQNPKCKWKQVLGFDDGLSISGSLQAKLESPQIFHLFQSRSVPSYPQFPTDITFFRSRGDITISPSSPAPSPSEGKPLPTPPPLFCVTVQNDHQSPTNAGRPDLILHSGPSRASSIVSFAKFCPGNQETDITLCPPPRKPVAANFSRLDLPLSTRSSTSSSESTWSGEEVDRSSFRYERLVHTGGRFMPNKYSFNYTPPQTLIREKFEWRYTSRRLARYAEVDREAGGMKLVRIGTNETVAVYVGLGQISLEDNPSRVVGMFRFLKGEAWEDLEEDFEMLAVMSILSVVERNRRVTLSKTDLSDLY